MICFSTSETKCKNEHWLIFQTELPGCLHVVHEMPASMHKLFIAGKKLRNADEKKVKGEKKKKNVSKPSESAKPSSTTLSQDHMSLHTFEQKTQNVLGVIEEISMPDVVGGLQTPADESKTTCNGKTKEKKKIKKKDSIGKENLGSEVPNGLDSFSINPSCAKKDLTGQEAEKKKKRKSSKLDMEGKSELKKPKTNKSRKQLEEDGPSSHQILGENEGSGDLDVAEKQSSNCITPDADPKKDKVGKGLSKQDIPKLKKPRFGASPLVSPKCESAEQSPQFSKPSLETSMSPNSAPRRQKHNNDGPSKRKKPKFGVAPQNSSQPNSQSSNSNLENTSSPNQAATEHQVAEESSKHKKPKKPKFGAKLNWTLQCSQQLSDLAQELGEIMKKTEKESSDAEELQIPVIKAKKTVPVFSKTAPKM